MEKYDQIAVVGEGSYGLVMKCRHRETGQLVAIKKFVETDDDDSVKRLAHREIRMLRKLRHENLVNMIEVFRRKRRYYLVFEFVDHTILDELEEKPGGLGEFVARCHMFQVLRAINFCHSNNIIHRDIKPENVLVSRLGVVKVCDFGFARLLVPPGESYTGYVATRWYRAPELLVSDTKYGREVDIWAAGCLFAEMMSGDPLFPGDSDIDQLYLIVRMLGKLAPRHQHMIAKNPKMKGLKRPDEEPRRTIQKAFTSWPVTAAELLAQCLQLDPANRPQAVDLLKHPYFTNDNFPERFLPELLARVDQEFQSNPLLKRQMNTAGSAARRPRNSINDLRAPGLQWKMNFGVNENSATENRKFISEYNKAVPTHRKLSDGNNVMEEDTENKAEPVRHSVVGFLTKLTPSQTKVSVQDIQLIGNISDLQPPPAPSPTPFQSLQPCNIASELNPSNIAQVLHPSINNLSFHVKESNVSFQARFPEPLKKSPLVLGNRLKDVNRQGHTTHSSTTLNMPSRTTYVRRLDRGLMLDICTPESRQPTAASPTDSWVNNSKKISIRQTKSQVPDDFSLPNVPGASGSPNKALKKKLNPAPHNVEPFISPRRNSSRAPSESPKAKFSSNLPFV